MTTKTTATNLSNLRKYDRVEYVLDGEVVVAGRLAYIKNGWVGIIEAGRTDEYLASHVRAAR